MPHITVDVIAPIAPETRSTILNESVAACVEAIGAHPSAIVAQVTEHPAEAFFRPEGHSDAFVLVTVALYEGRTAEQKSRYAELLRHALEVKAAIPACDVWVRFDDKARTDLLVIHAS